MSSDMLTANIEMLNENDQNREMKDILLKNNTGLKFVSKKEREELRIQQEKELKLKQEELKSKKQISTNKRKLSEGEPINKTEEKYNGSFDISQEMKDSIRKQYLGVKVDREKKKEFSTSKFKFDWDATEDTSLTDPLYAEAYFSNTATLTKEPGLGRKFSRNYFDLKNWREKSLEEMEERDWRIVREDFEIFIVSGSSTKRKVPNPIRSWTDLSKLAVSRDLLDAVKKLGYESPTPVQMQCIPVGIQHRDLIGVAETGSGKTLSFLVPLLNYLERQPSSKFKRLSDDGPLGLILAPTRELAQQITDEAERMVRLFSRACATAKTRFVCIVGGTSIEAQGLSLRQGADVVVATPGRLIDCIESRYLVFNQCDYVVLDEADTMINMGFEPQVELILEKLNNVHAKSSSEADTIKQELLSAEGKESFRTTVMFSATMPRSVETLARKYMKFPVVVRVGDRDTSKNQRIEQHIVMCSEATKASKFKAAVGATAPPVIVFVNSRVQCKPVSQMLSDLGFSVTELHAGKTQTQREENLELFKSKEVDVLVATDVASRGLDISGIQHVINYDMPSSIEKYTHRIGRTGRAGKSGLATTFLTEHDSEMFKDLHSYLLGTGAVVPKELEHHPSVKGDVSTLPLLH